MTLAFGRKLATREKKPLSWACSISFLPRWIESWVVLTSHWGQLQSLSGSKDAGVLLFPTPSQPAGSPLPFRDPCPGKPQSQRALKNQVRKYLPACPQQSFSLKMVNKSTIQMTRGKINHRTRPPLPPRLSCMSDDGGPSGALPHLAPPSLLCE